MVKKEKIDDISEDLEKDERLGTILENRLESFKRGPIDRVMPSPPPEFPEPPMDTIIASPDPDEGYLAAIDWIGFDLTKAELAFPLNYMPKKGEQGEIEYVEEMDLVVPFYANSKEGPVPVVKIYLRSRSDEGLGLGPYPEADRGPFYGLVWWPGLEGGKDTEIDIIYLQQALEYVGKKYESRVTLSPTKRR